MISQDVTTTFKFSYSKLPYRQSCMYAVQIDSDLRILLPFSNKYLMTQFLQLREISVSTFQQICQKIRSR